MRGKRRETGLRFLFGNIALLFVVGLAVLAGIGGSIFFLLKPSPLPRYTVVIIGNPYLIVSWNRTDDSMVAVSIPSTVRIEATHGYGTYSLEALYKLDRMDNRGGTLLLTSLTDALGYPVDAYLDMSTGRRLLSDDIRSDFHDVWTFSHITNALLGQRGSVSPASLFGLVKTAMTIRDEKLQTFDFKKYPGLIVQEELPDGTTADTLDARRVADTLIGMFEDPKIREERLRVALFNTTKLQGIGQKASNILSTMGIFVVSVTNDDTERSSCLIRTKQDLVESKTIQVLQALHSCSIQTTQEPLRSDVDVYLGYEYAQRYEAYSRVE